MGKGLSLHIGLNSVSASAYGGWSGPLNACEADARDMRALAQARGFAPTMLLTKAGTRAKTLAALKSAAGALHAGDFFLLTYSGHGGQLPDQNGDETDDHADETWCLYDGELVDDELNAALGAFAAGVRVLVLSDSCHSGSSTKALADGTLSLTRRSGEQVLRGPHGQVMRLMPPEYALRAYEAKRAVYDKILKNPKLAGLPAPKASVLLISGCQDSQTSADGTFNGLFTGTLKTVWAGGGFKGGYVAFHKAIVGRMPSSQRPNLFPTGASNPKFLAQTPFTI